MRFIKNSYIRALLFGCLFFSGLLNAACPTPGALVLIDTQPATPDGSELAFSPDGNHLALSSFSGGIQVYSVDSSGVLSSIQTIPGTPIANYIEYAPNGLHVAITDSVINLLTVYDVNPATGILSNPVNYGAAASLDFPNSLNYSPTGDFVTVSNFNVSYVSVFTADKQTGALTFVNNFTGAPALNSPISVSYSPDGLFVAVAYAFSDTVRVFAVNQTTGALTQIAGSDVATLTQPNFLVYSPDGRFAAVAHSGASFVRVYTVNQTTGAFSFLQDVASVPAGGSIDYSPDGRFATVVSSTTNQATVYSVDTTTGFFTPLQNPLIIGSVSESAVYSPNGKFVAISNRTANTVSTYATNATATAVNQTVAVACGASVTFAANICGEDVRLVSLSTPLHGSAVIVSDTQITYTPDLNFSGGDSFTYTAEDDLGNTATATVTITFSVGPTATLFAAPTTICPGSNSTLTLTISGGVAPYILHWSDGVTQAAIASTVTRTVAPTNTTGYFVTVTDVNGCFDVSNTVTVTVNSLPTIAVSASPTTICSGQSATLVATTAGNPLPTSVSWSDGVTSSVPASGIVTRTVSPATTTAYSAAATNTCGTSPTSNTVTVTVDQLSITSQPVAMPSSICVGENSTLTFSATGASPFTVVWSDGVTQTNVTSPFVRTVTPTTTTTYFAQVTDSNGCQVTTNTTSVTVNANPTAVLASACDAVCVGNSSLLTLTLTGTAPFTINWSDGTSQTTSSTTITHAVTPSTTTDYFADVTDTNGCMTTSNTITVTVNSLPTATLSASPATICSGDSSTLTLVMSGAAPFDIAWSDGVIQTNVNSPVTRNVSPAVTTNYSAQVTDSNGCQITSNTVMVAVNQSPTSATLTAAPTTICSGDSSTLTTTITGGTAPYTVMFSDGFSQTGGSPLNRIVSPAVTTTYTITSITDANGCSPVTLPPPVTITVNPSPASATLTAAPTTICSGDSSTLTTTITGGAAPYTVTFSDGFSQTGSSPLNRVVSPTITTTYTITSITDNNGCSPATLPAPVTVTVNPSPTSATLTAAPTTICSGDSSTLTTTVTGGTAPYTVSFSDGFSQTGSSPLNRIVSPTTTTTYTITSITDANGCSPVTLPAPVTVTVNPSPTAASLSASPATICSGDSSTLTTTITGGTAPYTVMFSDGFSQTDSSPLNRVVSPTVTTTYTITSITDANGCSPVTLPAPVTVNVNPSPTSATLTAAPTTICSGDSSTLTTIITGGTAPYTVMFSDGFSQTDSSPLNRVVSPTVTTTYTITSIVDANGCSPAVLPAPVTVTVNPSPTSATLIATPTTICSGDSSTLTTTITGGTAPYTVSFSDGFSQTDSSPLNRVVSPTTTTTYTITSIIDNNGCLLVALPAPVTVIVNELPTSAKLKASPATICLGGSSTLTTTITGGTAPYTVTYSDGFSQMGSSPLNRVVSPTITTTYTITSIVDNNGCSPVTLPAPVTIAVNQSPASATLTASPATICSGDSSTLTTTITGGTAPYTVTYSDGFSQAGDSPLARVVNPSTTTTYIITSIADANGCSPVTLPAPVTVTVGTSPTSATFTASPTTICSGGSSTLKTTITGGAAPYTITYSDGFSQTGDSPVTRVVSPKTTTTYTITSIVDNNGCSLATLPASVIVAVNALPTASLISSSPDVCSSGSVTLTLTITGSGPFNVTWSDGFMQTNVTSPVTRTVFPTTTTSYSAAVTDSNGCQTTSNTVIVGFNLQGIVTAQPAAICIGGSSTLILAVTVGTAPFDIVWSDGFIQTGVTSPITRVVSPTQSTSYFAKITDSNGCSGNSNAVTISVSTAAPSETLAASRTTLCSGESTALTLDITGGGPFTINWSDGVIQTSTTTPVTRIVSPTVTTSYSAMVTNACGSSVSPTVTVTVNPIPVVSLTASPDRLCPAVSSTLTLTISSGAAPFNIVWSDGFTQTGVTSSVTRVVLPTVTTSYSAIVTDANGCVGTSNTVTVAVGPKSMLIAAPDAICRGDSSGLTLTITGSAPFDVVWSDGFTQAGVTSPVTRVVSPIQSTNYFAQVTDSNGCQDSSNTVQVSVSTDTPTETLTASRNTICLGDSSTLTLNITGGGPFDVEWSDGFIQTDVTSPVTRVVSPTQTTNYFARVTNACGSSESPVVTVTVNSLPVALLTASPDRLCLGVSSTLTLTITGGVAPFDVVWSDGFTQTGVTSPVTRVVSPTETTSYFSTITDSNGCQTTSNTVTVIFNPLSVLTATPSALCQGETSVLKLVISGEPPFVINWSDGVTQTTDTSSVLRQVTPLITTSYFATVTDGNNCQANSNAVTINVSTTVPSETLTVAPSTICSGEATVLVLDITGGGPFTINWSDGFTQTSNTTPVTRTVSPAETTSYFATVTNACGSSASPEVTVTVNPVPIATLTTSQVGICPRTFATLTLSITGQGPFDVEWSDGVVQTGVNSPVVRLVSPNTTTAYSAVVTNSIGCQGSSNTVTISINEVPEARLTVRPETICLGGSVTLKLRITGAGPFDVRWSDGVVQTDVTSPVTRRVSPAETTNYFAQVTDSNGCENLSNPVTVTVGDTVAATLAASPNPICAGDSSTLTLNITGKAPFTIRWSDGIVQKTRQSTITRSVTPLDTTLYRAQVTDSSGCKAVSNSVTVQVNQPPFVTLSASKTHILPGEVVTLTAVPSGNAPFTLEWSDGFVQRNVIGVTTRQVAPLVTTTYNLTIIDRNGCRFDPPQGITIFVERFRKVSPISRAIINKYCK